MMVFGVKPECVRCKVTECNIWRRDERDQVLCTDCFSSVHAANPKLTPPKTLGKEGEEDEEETRKDEKMDAEEHKDADSSNGNGGKDEDHEGEKDKETGKTSEKRETKRKTRKGRQGGKGSIPKGKGRRYIFKKSVSRLGLSFFVFCSRPTMSLFIFVPVIYVLCG